MGLIRHRKHGPEWHIQEDLRRFLKVRGWLVERMIGNAFQMGIPDLYLHHPRWGERWVDVKQPKNYTFTREQKLKWPLWDSFGAGIWILTAATQAEYDKLFRPPNWRDFWKSSWVQPDIEALLDALDDEEI